MLDSYIESLRWIELEFFDSATIAPIDDQREQVPRVGLGDLPRNNSQTIFKDRGRNGSILEGPGRNCGYESERRSFPVPPR